MIANSEAFASLWSSAFGAVIRDKKKMLNRVRGIRGQVEAIESAIEREADCSDILTYRQNSCAS